MAILIAPTTSAFTSKYFSPFADNTTGLKCSYLGSGEYLTLQVYDEGILDAVTYKDPNDLGWTDVIVKGALYQCTSDNNLISFALDSNKYRVKKSVTALQVGVSFTQTVPLG